MLMEGIEAIRAELADSAKAFTELASEHRAFMLHVRDLELAADAIDEVGRKQVDQACSAEVAAVDRLVEAGHIGRTELPVASAHDPRVAMLMQQHNSFSAEVRPPSAEVGGVGARMLAQACSPPAQEATAALQHSSGDVRSALELLDNLTCGSA